MKTTQNQLNILKLLNYYFENSPCFESMTSKALDFSVKNIGLVVNVVNQTALVKKSGGRSVCYVWNTIKPNVNTAIRIEHLSHSKSRVYTDKLKLKRAKIRKEKAEKIKLSKKTKPYFKYDEKFSISNEDLDKLNQNYTMEDIDNTIQNFCRYVDHPSNYKKYKSMYRTIDNWMRRNNSEATVGTMGSKLTELLQNSAEQTKQLEEVKTLNKEKDLEIVKLKAEVNKPIEKEVKKEEVVTVSFLWGLIKITK
jgi:hypothetical protein